MTAQENYIRAEFTSALFRFVDDVEFYFPEEKSGETVIHIRSASRIGYSDLGANRKRIERIRSEFVNYRKRLPGIYTAMGVHAIWIEEDFSSGAPYINNSLRISEEIEDFVSSSFANFNLGMCLSFQCKFEKALSHLEKCLDLSKLADSEVWIKKNHLRRHEKWHQVVSGRRSCPLCRVL